MISEDLNCLVAEIPDGRVTLSWISARIRGRSAELALMILGLAAMLPGISTPIAFILIAIALSLMLTGRSLPLPIRVSEFEFPSRSMRRLLGSAASASAWCDKHGRWGRPGTFPGMRRVAGLLILVLSVMLLVPVPLSNVFPGLMIAALAFACLERDTLLFCASAAIAVLAIAMNVLMAMALGSWLHLL
jgi:hypothetical protein